MQQVPNRQSPVASADPSCVEGLDGRTIDQLLQRKKAGHPAEDRDQDIGNRNQRRDNLASMVGINRIGSNQNGYDCYDQSHEQRARCGDYLEVSQ